MSEWSHIKRLHVEDGREREGDQRQVLAGHERTRCDSGGATHAARRRGEERFGGKSAGISDEACVGVRDRAEPKMVPDFCYGQ